MVSPMDSMFEPASNLRTQIRRQGSSTGVRQTRIDPNLVTPNGVHSLKQDVSWLDLLDAISVSLSPAGER